jgi:hypothetical protein
MEVTMPSRKAPRLQRPLVDTAGLCAYTGIRPRQVRRWIEKRKLPVSVIKLNERNYFDLDEVDEWLASLPREIPASADAVRQARGTIGKGAKPTRARATGNTAKRRAAKRARQTGR